MSKSLEDWKIDLAIVRGQLSQINKLIVEFHAKREHLEDVQEYIKKRYIEHGE